MIGHAVRVGSRSSNLSDQVTIFHSIECFFFPIGKQNFILFVKKGPCAIRGHKGQNSTGTRCRGFLVLESRCRGFLVLELRCRGLIVSVSRCRGFLALESRCRGVLVLESRCRGICASTASFSFLLNLLCHIINVDTCELSIDANYFVSQKLVFEINE